MSGKKKAQKAADNATKQANQASAQAADQANSQTNSALNEANSAASQAGGDVGSPNIDPNALTGPGGRNIQYANFGSDYKPEFPYLHDQLILNSGRVLLNSKHDSTLLFGKKAIALSSDGTLNFDSRLKYIVNSPRIELGLGDKASVTLGEPLIDYLTSLTTSINDLALELAKVFNRQGDHPFQGVNTQAERLVNTIRNLNADVNSLKSNVVFVGKNIVTSVKPSITEEAQTPATPPPNSTPGTPGDGTGGGSDYTSGGDQQNQDNQNTNNKKNTRFKDGQGLPEEGSNETPPNANNAPGSQDTLNRNTAPGGGNSQANNPAPTVRSAGEQPTETGNPTPEPSSPSTYQSPKPSKTTLEE
jgi:hypothetical protein